MCEYCEKETIIQSSYNERTDKVATEAYLKNNTLFVSATEHSTLADIFYYDEFTIKYCPMCGRKLTDD